MCVCVCMKNKKATVNDLGIKTTDKHYETLPNQSSRATGWAETVSRKLGSLALPKNKQPSKANHSLIYVPF